ncbi:Ubiquitin-related modifier 1 [Mycena indigotica]|uniref:Ubiquitin-related modifier 1 n=1 Tax=Mycena indigotica TaxID=2126181 RepID=A0A8H6S4V2_9AGAR|nr:Ubiquitin-related modifier 1 [Mycena indigotica]KAF7292851.1 Ubiquitin-related modifier 1 [Mycena indigotica]
MSQDTTISLKVEFGGGLELLFSNKRSHQLTVPATVPKSTEDNATKQADITFLIRYLRDNLLQERQELFMENETVRPGILVLVNDTDWELEGEGEYVLKNGDEVVFISTLHGG